MMTKKIPPFVLVFMLFAVTGMCQVVSSPKFAEVVYDFGKIKQGKPVSHKFIFRNVGQQPVIIKNVTTACGCTVPEYNKTPVMPGSSGSISIVYDAREALPFNKTIIVLFATEKAPVILNIKGEVLR